MNFFTPSCSFRLNTAAKGVYAVFLTALFAASASAQIASGTTGIDNTGNAASELAACNNGTTQQSRATCITEVQNANAAKRAGKVDNAGGQFTANALARCDVQTGDEKVACRARVAGYGNPQGSVAGGGVISEIETVTTPNEASTVVIQPQSDSSTILVMPAK